MFSFQLGMDNTVNCTKIKSKIRVNGDYRLLNAVTKQDSYPIPSLQDFTQNLAGKTVFSTIVLVRTFHNIIVIHPDNQKEQLFTPNRLYQWNRSSATGLAFFRDLLNNMDWAISHLFSATSKTYFFSLITTLSFENCSSHKLTEYG